MCIWPSTLTAGWERCHQKSWSLVQKGRGKWNIRICILFYIASRWEVSARKCWLFKFILFFTVSVVFNGLISKWNLNADRDFKKWSNSCHEITGWTLEYSWWVWRRQMAKDMQKAHDRSFSKRRPIHHGLSTWVQHGESMLVQCRPPFLGETGTIWIDETWVWAIYERE